MKKTWKYILTGLLLCVVAFVFYRGFSRKAVDGFLSYDGVRYQWVDEENLTVAQRDFLQENNIAIKVTEDMIGDFLGHPDIAPKDSFYYLKGSSRTDVLIWEYNGRYKLVLSEQISDQ